MQFSKYDVFLKVLELGSLTKAAEVLGYTQSAVSQTVRALENDFGITLLVRNRMGIALTSEGSQLLPYMQDICGMHYKLREKVDAIKGICSGEIRIGAYHLAACHLLPAIIREFLKEYPSISFQIMEGDYTEIREWIFNGRIDFGFLSIQDIQDLECIPYQEDVMYAVFPSDAPESQAFDFPLAQLGQYPFIYLDEGRVNDCTRIFKKNHVSPQIAYTVKEDDTVLAMVEQHFGMSILPALAQRKHCYDVTFIPTVPSCSRMLGIAIHNRPAASGAVKVFLSFIGKQRESAGHSTRI